MHTVPESSSSSRPSSPKYKSSTSALVAHELTTTWHSFTAVARSAMCGMPTVRKTAASRESCCASITSKPACFSFTIASSAGGFTAPPKKTI